MFVILPGARALWSLPHICVVYLPRKVLIFDYFLISLPHTHSLFSFRETSVTLTWLQKLTIQFLRCLPGFLPLAPLAIFLGTNFNLLMGIIRQEENKKRVAKYLVSSFVHCKRKCAATQNNSLKKKHYHSAIAAALHVGEAVQAFFLASLQYNLNPLVVLLWTLNVFFFGIFGFWPLAFPQATTMMMINDSRLKKDSIWNSDILCNDWYMKNFSGESKFFL